MWAGAESIPYLLFIPYNIRKKETAIKTGLCLCYFLLLWNQNRRWEKRGKAKGKDWNRQPFPPFFRHEKFTHEKFLSFLCLSWKQWNCAQHIWQLWIPTQRKINREAEREHSCPSTANQILLYLCCFYHSPTPLIYPHTHTHSHLPPPSCWCSDCGGDQAEPAQWGERAQWVLLGQSMWVDCSQAYHQQTPVPYPTKKKRQIDAEEFRNGNRRTVSNTQTQRS